MAASDSEDAEQQKHNQGFPGDFAWSAVYSIPSAAAASAAAALLLGC
jgi:hypothetical protein